MKLKSYILVGYIISTLLTIIVVFWAVQRMLIEEREIYFLVGMTLVASFIGAGISLFLLSPVFTSLGKLKEHAKRVADKDFPSNLEVQGPVEFQQLGQAFNEMSHDLQATFDSLEESEREKGLMIAQLSHDIKTPHHFNPSDSRRDFGWGYQGVGASSLSSNYWTPDRKGSINWLRS